MRFLPQGACPAQEVGAVSSPWQKSRALMRRGIGAELALTARLERNYSEQALVAAGGAICAGHHHGRIGDVGIGVQHFAHFIQIGVHLFERGAVGGLDLATFLLGNVTSMARYVTNPILTDINNAAAVPLPDAGGPKNTIRW